jgi:hypothetical protein
MDAMAAFREHFSKLSEVVFVFVSDDMAWGREKLETKSNGAQADLYFAGNGDGVDPDAIGNDLALLTECNHTIQVLDNKLLWLINKHNFDHVFPVLRHLLFLCWRPGRRLQDRPSAL